MGEDEPQDRLGSDGLAAERAGHDHGRAGAGNRLARATHAVAVSLRDPVIVVLLLAGFFDGISGNPVHWIILYGAAFALGRDALRRRSGIDVDEPASTGIAASLRELAADPGASDRAAARRMILVPLALIGVLIYGVMVGGFARYSWPVTVVVVVTGCLVLVMSWPGPLRHREAPGPIGTVGTVAWLAAFIGLGLWEFTQLVLQPNLTTNSYAHPTLSALSDPILATHPGRTIGLIVWLLFGWFLMGR